jgi:hypothetical protein
MKKRFLSEPATRIATPPRTAPKPVSALGRWVKDQHGMGTLEVVILIAVLIAIALIFNSAMRKFSNNLFKEVFDDRSVIDRIDSGY